MWVPHYELNCKLVWDSHVSPNVLFSDLGFHPGISLHLVIVPLSLLWPRTISVFPCFSWTWSFGRVVVTYFVDRPPVWVCLMYFSDRAGIMGSGRTSGRWSILSGVPDAHRLSLLRWKKISADRHVLGSGPCSALWCVLFVCHSMTEYFYSGRTFMLPRSSYFLQKQPLLEPLQGQRRTQVQYGPQLTDRAGFQSGAGPCPSEHFPVCPVSRCFCAGTRMGSIEMAV